MPAGDVFGLDGFFLNKSNPVVVSTIGINSTGVGAGITVVSGVLNAAAGIATLTLSTAAGLSTTPFYVGAKIAVSGLSVSGTAHTGYNGTFVVTGFAGTTTVSYATTGYVGGVTASITGQTGRVMLVTDTAVTNTTWSSAQTHGWFGGGDTPGTPGVVYSTVDRIDFSNDTGTANIRSPLSLGRVGPTATGNSNYGWFGGGSAYPSYYSTVDRIDFSNDSSTASPRGPLSSAKYNHAATGNSNYGWFGGGSTNFSDQTTTVDRIDFSNDSATASPRGPLSLARRVLAATGNSNYGWFGGGSSYNQFFGDPVFSRVDRIDFSNDSPAVSVRSPLSSARSQLAATGNSNYGWFGGGYLEPSIVYSTVDRIDFSNDSPAVSVRGPLSSARGYLAATGNSNYGWFGGGYIPGATATVDRIDFSNDSVSASPRGPLSSARFGSGATSGQARSSSVRLQKGGNFGWFGGGATPSQSNSVDRIDFSNDSSTLTRGSLSLARYGLAATGNSNYGWFGGGYSFPPATFRSTVDRIDFSNDSPSASPRSSLSTPGRSQLAATGNSNYGWFGGGIVGAPTVAVVATVDRINFSNDSVSALARGLLSSARYRLAATGNSNYGWFGGGNNPPEVTLDRIDFSNDSASASPRSSLSIGKRSLAATGNSNYGWFGGGYRTTGTPSVYSSTVERIDFSNDSASVLARGPLNTPATGGRVKLTATGNSNYGWFGGGTIFPGLVQTIDRIDFSNDDAIASRRGGLLSIARDQLAAVSNTPT